MASLHISIAAEPVLHVGGFAVSNSLLTSYVVMLLLFIVAASVSTAPEVKLPSRVKVKKAPALVEMFIGGFYNFLSPILGSRVDALFPMLMTFFLFIIIGNWVGILPGVGPIGIEEHGKIIPLFRGPSADLSTTLALAIVSVVSTQVLSIKALGVGGYLHKFFNFSNPINFFVGILEIISEFAKLLSFSFRLFGNIFAGEVLLVVITAIAPFALSPFFGLEIFVGFIQALVFTMLTAVFISVATEKHH